MGGAEYKKSCFTLDEKTIEQGCQTQNTLRASSSAVIRTNKGTKRIYKTKVAVISWATYDHPKGRNSPADHEFCSLAIVFSFRLLFLVVLYCAFIEISGGV